MDGERRIVKRTGHVEQKEPGRERLDLKYSTRWLANVPGSDRRLLRVQRRAGTLHEERQSIRLDHAHEDPAERAR